MAKLKLITLDVIGPVDFNYEYRAIDSDGKVLGKPRNECLSCKGTTFIAALITKNWNSKYSYSMVRLFTSVDLVTNEIRSKRREPGERRRPYAIAVIPEQKEALIAKGFKWLELEAAL